MKMAPSLVRLYEQMPDPKYVIAMGACTITGGMFSTDSYTTVRGVDKLIPVDVYLPGCPPKPEAIIDAVIKLRKKVSQEETLLRGAKEQIHKFYTMKHELKPSAAIYTGKYMQEKSRVYLMNQIEANEKVELFSDTKITGKGEGKYVF
jgi:NAD(P)H-quinone oxidoreductase subunit K